MAKPTKGSPAPKKEIPPTFKVMLEEAWRDWIKSVAMILVVIGAYFAYDRKVIPDPGGEQIWGVVVVVAILLGILSATAMPVLELIEKREHKLLFGAFVAIWALSAGYPSLRRAYPKQELAETKVGHCTSYNLEKPGQRECAVPVVLDAKVPIAGGVGPYEIDVSGALRGGGEVEANYRLTLSGENRSTDTVEGTLARKFDSVRTSRRSAATTLVRNENTQVTHRLDNLRGSEIHVVADAADENLEDGLRVTFHKAGFDSRIFLGLGLLCLLAALVLDYRISDPKNKIHSYLTVGTAMTLVFAFGIPPFFGGFPAEATPLRVVKPAIAELFRAGAFGIVGWLLAIVVKSFKPQPKKIVTK